LECSPLLSKRLYVIYESQTDTIVSNTQQSRNTIEWPYHPLISIHFLSALTGSRRVRSGYICKTAEFTLLAREMRRDDHDRPGIPTPTGNDELTGTPTPTGTRTLLHSRYNRDFVSLVGQPKPTAHVNGARVDVERGCGQSHELIGPA
jgi:hypothetical protein